MCSPILLFLARIGLIVSAFASLLFAQALVSGSGSVLWCLLLLGVCIFSAYQLYRFSIAPFVSDTSRPGPARSVRAAVPQQSDSVRTEHAA